MYPHRIILYIYNNSVMNNLWKLKFEQIEAEIGDARSKYKTESLEMWLDDNSKEEFCDLIAEG